MITSLKESTSVYTIPLSQDLNALDTSGANPSNLLTMPSDPRSYRKC